MGAVSDSEMTDAERGPGRPRVPEVDQRIAALAALAARADELVAAGERSMRALVDAADTQRIVMEQRRELTNVNTPQDLD